MKKKFLFFSIIHCIQILQVSCFFKMTKVECTDVDPNFQKIHYCYLKPLRRNVAAFYAKVELFHVVSNSWVNINCIYKKSNAYRNSLANMTGDACAFIKEPKKYPFIGIIYDLIAPYTNMNHSCPYKGLIIFDGFFPEHSVLKLPIPSGEYLLNIKWIMNGAYRIDVKVWFAFEEMKNGKRTYEILQ